MLPDSLQDAGEGLLQDASGKTRQKSLLSGASVWFSGHSIIGTRRAKEAGSRYKTNNPNEGVIMIGWAITFLIIALIAALFGFGGLAGTAVGIAKILFFVFLVLFVVSLLLGRRTPPA
jgi:uncharacterized membrane protein YtjA (UPF0391 family)